MKSIIACFILFGAAFAVPSGERISYDFTLDQTLKEVVPILRARKYTYWNFGPSQFGELKFGAGQIVGFDSVFRNGPSYVTANEDKFEIDAHLGWNYLGVVTPDLKIGGQAMSGIMNLNGVAVHVKVVLDDECGYEVKKLAILEVQSAVLLSSVPEYNGKDITDLYRNSVVPGVNDELEKNLKSITTHFQEWCKAEAGGRLK